MHRQALAVEIGEEPGQPSHGPAPLRKGTVAAAARHPRFQPADLFLRDLNEKHAAPADLHVEAAELADRVFDPVEEMCVLLDEELRAVVAARFLVRQHGQDDVARKLRCVAGCAQEGGDHHRDAALHVERPASPDPAVDQVAAERRARPALTDGRDDVDVPLQQQGRPVAPAAQARDEIRPRGILCVQLHLASRLLEQSAQERDAVGLVPRRIRGVEADQLTEQLDRCHRAAIAASRPSTSSEVL